MNGGILVERSGDPHAAIKTVGPPAAISHLNPTGTG
jgi:hypothetical protein